MADASPDDVRGVIETRLDDPDIKPILDRAARDIGRQYVEDDFADPDHRGDLEAVLTAYRIASGKDRRLSSKQLGSLRKTYEASEVDKLRGQLRKLDPGDAFAGGHVIRDTSRYSRAVTNERDT